MYELLVGNKFRNKVKLLFNEILNRFYIVVGNFLNILYVSGILLAEVLPYLTQTVV